MTHGSHTAGVTGFLHAHHVAFIVAATAVVVGGAALGAAWHSSRPASTTRAVMDGQMSQRAIRTAGHVDQWMAHHHAYHAQLAWLRHHGSRTHGWMAHYRGDRHELDWMLAHRAYAHERWHGDHRADLAHATVMHDRWMWVGHAHAYRSQLGWLRHHGDRDHGWMAHYRGYLLAHRTDGDMPSGYRRYQANMRRLRDHRGWNGAHMRHSMDSHMGGDWGMDDSC